jgi:hypothetical protein
VANYAASAETLRRVWAKLRAPRSSQLQPRQWPREGKPFTLRMLVSALVPIIAFAHAWQAADALEVTAPAVAINSFTIRLTNGQTRFHSGETITLELGYGAQANAPASPYTTGGSRPGLSVYEFDLEPRAGVTDPLENYLGSVGGVWMGPPPRFVPFIEKGGSWAKVDLNEWFQFSKPGNYRLTVLAREGASAYAAYDNRATAATVASNTIAFTIIPADAAWQQATLRQALGLVESKRASPHQQVGCRMLRFLTTRDAVDAMIRHYADGGICGMDYRYGLFAFPDREYVVNQMDDGILEPSVAISADYLRTLATISVYDEHPEYLPVQNGRNLGKGGTMGGALGAHWNVVQTEEDRFTRELIGALGNKMGQARALSLEGIFDSPFLGRPTLLESTDPALLVTLRQRMAEEFLKLPTSDQSMLLWIRWPNIASPAMLPVLRQLYDNPPPGPIDQFIPLVLERIEDLSPAEGRALIVKEFTRPHPQLDLRFVYLLPDKEIPALDAPLTENLEASNGAEMTIVDMIGRYATPAVFPRVLAMEQDRVGKMPCEPQDSFLAYALKSDPITGQQLIEKALASRKATGCYTMVIGDVAQRHYAPELEQTAIEHLNDPNLEVEVNAAATLGRYSSAAAEQSLWDRLRKWHAAWAGRASELPNGTGVGLTNGLETELELALVRALATGQAWFAGPAKLQQIKSLCVSPMELREVADMISRFSSAPLISVSTFGNENFSAGVLQYNPRSLEALEQKLAQFPSSTVFSVDLNGSNTQELKKIMQALESVTSEHGSRIEQCRFWAGTPSQDEIPTSSPSSPCYQPASSD